MKVAALIITFVLFIAVGTVRSETWTSVDGRKVNGLFIKLENNVLHLQDGARVYAIPIQKLDAVSRGYAQYLQGEAVDHIVPRSLAPKPKRPNPF